MSLISTSVLFLASTAEAAVAHEWTTSVGGVAGQALVIFFFVLLNGFFVASEFAMVKVRESQIEAAIEAGLSGAKAARHATKHLDGYLSATQLGITLCSIALGMLGEPFVAGLVQPLLFKIGIVSVVVVHSISVGIAYAFITFLHVVIGEITPKTLAIRKSLAATLLAAPILRIFYIVLKPGIWILNGTAAWLLRTVFRIDPVSEGELAHSEEELRHIVAESQKSKSVTETEKDILLNALALNDRCVRDVMTPRNQVISLDSDESFEANWRVAVESKHTRFPLVEGHLDHSIGVIHIKDLLPLVGTPNPDLRKIRRDLVPVPELMPIDKLLRMFLDRHLHIALVIDEFGGAVGIVTLDNVLEEIVGDIQDEFDFEKPEFRPINKDEFEVDGTLNLYELRDHAEIDLESEDVTTIGGYVTHMLGRLPKPGDRVEIGEYQVMVTKVDQRRVLQLHFKRQQKAEQSGKQEDE